MDRWRIDFHSPSQFVVINIKMLCLVRAALGLWNWLWVVPCLAFDNHGCRECQVLKEKWQRV